MARRVLELTDGKKCPVVYDSVGKDTWETSLDCVAPRGLLVSFGNASGPVTGVNLGILSQKGSLYVTRPTLGSYADTPEKLQAMADEPVRPDRARRHPHRDQPALRPGRSSQGAYRTGRTANHRLDRTVALKRVLRPGG